MKEDLLYHALRETLISPNEADRNLEPANVVDGLFAISRALHHIAEELALFRKGAIESPQVVETTGPENRGIGDVF